MERLNSFWFGDRLGYLEQLSIKTALAQGHSYTLYSYFPDDLRDVPAGVEVRNAAEVMSDPRRVYLFEGKYKALGSNFFRYELLSKSLGYWVDLDLIFVRPLDLQEDYVFGWQSPKCINSAVLKLPASSAMLEELRNIPCRNWCPPYFGPLRRLRFYRQRAFRDMSLQDLPWGSCGPNMITYLAKKYGLASRAQAMPVFYPVPPAGAWLLFGEPSNVEALLTSDTIAIHLWKYSLGEFAENYPNSETYLGKMCRQYEILPRPGAPAVG